MRLAAHDKRQQGLIAVIGCVEPCQVVQVRGNRETKKLELRIEPGKCMHYYHYYLDPDYGLRYSRLQSWFPFTMHVGLNRRDWLARQMTNTGLAYEQKDNSFTWVQDWEAAQLLLDKQLRTAWAPLLDRWANESYPYLKELLAQPVPYYWSVQEGEYATDTAFRMPRTCSDFIRNWCTSPPNCSKVPRAPVHGLSSRQSLAGPAGFAGEVVTTIKELVEGTCVKHRALQTC